MNSRSAYAVKMQSFDKLTGNNMGNIIQLRPTARKTIKVQQITTSLMPKHVQENLIHTAIAFGFFLEDGECGISSDASREAIQALKNLEEATRAASQYTVETEMEVNEPI